MLMMINLYFPSSKVVVLFKAIIWHIHLNTVAQLTLFLPTDLFHMGHFQHFVLSRRRLWPSLLCIHIQISPVCNTFVSGCLRIGFKLVEGVPLPKSTYLSDPNYFLDLGPDVHPELNQIVQTRRSEYHR